MSHPHDCPINRETISGGLGLVDSYFQDLGLEVKSAYKQESSVSDTLLSVANTVRSEELDVSGNLSRYERKLVLAGYLVGVLHVQVQEGAKNHALESLLRKLTGNSDKVQDPEGED